MYYANKYRNGADPKPERAIKPKKGLKSKIKPLTLVEKLDRVFSQYVRKSSADDTQMGLCYTCGVRLHWKKLQCGHFMSRKHMATRWSLRNCRPQCSGCNEVKGGNLEVYAERLKLEYGDQILLSLATISASSKKFSKVELQQMIDEYTDLNKKFKN
jgi:hypothetical protein